MNNKFKLLVVAGLLTFSGVFADDSSSVDQLTDCMAGLNSCHASVARLEDLLTQCNEKNSDVQQRLVNSTNAVSSLRAENAILADQLGVETARNASLEESVAGLTGQVGDLSSSVEGLKSAAIATVEAHKVDLASATEKAFESGSAEGFEKGAASVGYTDLMKKTGDDIYKFGSDVAGSVVSAGDYAWNNPQEAAEKAGNYIVQTASYIADKGAHAYESIASQTVATWNSASDRVVNSSQTEQAVAAGVVVSAAVTYYVLNYTEKGKSLKKRFFAFFGK